jgi:hypothetical protein
MRPTPLLLAAGLTLATLPAGCGDNSKACGPGTFDDSGLCLPIASCGYGTRLDEATGLCLPDQAVVCAAGTELDDTGRCQIAADSCRAGTILVDHGCDDPLAAITVNLEEGPEPNGLGVFEASAGQAGNIAVPAPQGPAFVVHGVLAPRTGAEPGAAMVGDVDTYVIELTGPALLDIRATGLTGLVGGFVVVADVAPGHPMAAWRRFGLAHEGRTAMRDVYFPAAGRYLLAIADTRTLYPHAAGGSAPMAPGSGIPPTEYYVAISNEGLGAPDPLVPSGNVAAVSGEQASEDVARYALALAAGTTTVSLDMPDVHARASVVVVVDGEVRAVEDADGGPAQASITGPGDAVLVVDHVFHTRRGSSAPYELTATSN